MGGQIDQRVLHDTDPGGVRRGGVASADAATLVAVQPAVRAGLWINEAPFVGLWWVIAGTIGTLVHPEVSWWWWLVAAFAAVDGVLLGWIAVRARSARPHSPRRCRRLMGGRQSPGHPAGVVASAVADRLMAAGCPPRPQPTIRSGPARGTGSTSTCPAKVAPRAGQRQCWVYFHGSFAFGSKMLGSRALIYRLAAQGWVCVSAGRRLFRAGYRKQLTDARAALAWVHDNAQAYGGDPDRIFAAGGSAGANLAATAAMTGSDVAAVIGMYGYYGSVDAGIRINVTAGRRQPGRPTVLHHSRHPRHPGPAPRGPSIRRPGSCGLTATGRLCRTPRCAAQLRLLPVHPLPRRHRCDSAFRGTHAGVDGAKCAERPTRGSESEEPVVTRRVIPSEIASSHCERSAAMARVQRRRSGWRRRTGGGTDIRRSNRGTQCQPPSGVRRRRELPRTPELMP